MRTGNGLRELEDVRTEGEVDEEGTAGARKKA